jgi:phenylacetic acid degradation operon negative regulatory protein
MSSKAAAGRLFKEILGSLLRDISENNCDISTHKRKIYYLKRQGYLQKRNADFTLSLKGRAALADYKILRRTIPRTTAWDNKWRLVLFDIPVSKRKIQDAFRRRLKERGLTLYQNSVWVYPYPLENEISALAHFYRLNNCVSFATVVKISGEKSLRSKYGL